MDFATLGVSIKRDGGVETVRDLEKLAAIAPKAEKAVDGLNRTSRDNAAVAYAKNIDNAARSLRGFDAIAAKAAQQAAYATQQISKVTMRDLRADDIAAYGREMDQLRAKFNPLFAEQMRFRAITEEINHAQRVGAISANEATAALMREQAAFEQATTAANTNTAAMTRNNSAAAMRANTLNLGFQAQDIAMMTLMGQAPGMLAIQQGMQVGGIFAQMGSARAIAQGVGSAIAMLLNPLNLATIAFIGLGAAGVQALMGMMSGADDATTALEKHEDMLDKLLVGYDKARDAASKALEEALKLPQASAQSNAGAQRDDATERAVSAMEKALVLRREFEAYVGYAAAFNVPEETIDALHRTNDVITQITADGALSRQELDQLHTALTLLGDNSADQNIKDIVAEALQLVDAARAATAEVKVLDGVLNNLDRDIQIRISLSQEFGNAFADLKDLYQDPRNRFDQMREKAKNAADQAIATAQSYGQAVGAADEYKRVLDSINAAEAVADEKSGRGAARAQERLRDAYRDILRDANQFISAQQLEQQALGMTAEAAARLRYEQDLLNKAANDNIALTPAMRNELAGLAAQMAATEAQTKMLTQAANDNAALWGSVQDGVSGILKTWARGGDILDAISDKLLGIGDMLIDMAVRNLFQNAFGGGMGGGGFNLLSLFGVPSFDGGGWTGDGARSGGMDGKGGYIAMVHPQERIVDTTKGGNQGGQGKTVIEVRLSPELLAQVLQEAAGQSAQITRGMVEPVSRAVDQMAQQQRYA